MCLLLKEPALNFGTMHMGHYELCSSVNDL